ncbi:MAG TPA: type II toxin-antitoxin system PemK/MazF family toxin [Bacillales bacterium]|nr:type II toxin-antitoxin system PemK/MazF family toxin [Bacillales bacterium]
MSKYSIGEIYDVEVEFDERDGRAKTRPVVIIDVKNGDPIVVLVAALTGQGPKNPPTFFDQYKVALKDWKQAGLKKESFVKSSKTYTFDASSLRTYRGTLSEEDLLMVISNVSNNAESFKLSN